MNAATTGRDGTVIAQRRGSNALSRFAPGAPTAEPRSPLPFAALERVEEVAQVELLPRGQADAEPPIVKFHHVSQGRRRAVVEVRSPRRESAQRSEEHTSEL